MQHQVSILSMAADRGLEFIGANGARSGVAPRQYTAMPTARNVTIALDAEAKVSGLWLKPAKARTCLALATATRLALILSAL